MGFMFSVLLKLKIYAYVSAASNKALRSDNVFIDTSVAVSKFNNNKKKSNNKEVKVTHKKVNCLMQQFTYDDINT